MIDIFSQDPEPMDPDQLDLLSSFFDCSTSCDEKLHSTDPSGTTTVIESHSRDPTQNEIRENLTLSQKTLAETLYRKSRALASKPRQQIDENED